MANLTTEKKKRLEELLKQKAELLREDISEDSDIDIEEIPKKESTTLGGRIISGGRSLFERLGGGEISPREAGLLTISREAPVEQEEKFRKLPFFSGLAAELVTGTVRRNIPAAAMVGIVQAGGEAISQLLDRRYPATEKDEFGIPREVIPLDATQSIIKIAEQGAIGFFGDLLGRKIASGIGPRLDAIFSSASLKIDKVLNKLRINFDLPKPRVPLEPKLNQSDIDNAFFLEKNELPYFASGIHTASAALPRIENFMQQGLITGVVYNRLAKTIVKLAKEFAEKELNGIGKELPDIQLGKLTKALAQDIRTGMKEKYKREFEEAGLDIGLSKVIPTKEFKAAARLVIQNIGKSGKDIGGIKRDAAKILKMPAMLTLKEARRWQSIFGKNSTETLGFLKEDSTILYKGISDSIDLIESTNPAGLAALNQAKATFRKFADLRDNTVIGKLTKGGIDDLKAFNEVFNGEIGPILTMKNNLTKDQWSYFQRGFADKLINSSPGGVKAATLADLSGNLKKFSDDYLEEILGRDALYILKTIGDNATRQRLGVLQAPPGRKQAFSLINIIQGGLLMTAGGFGFGKAGSEGALASVLITMFILPRLIMSKTGSRLLAVGLTTPAKSEQGKVILKGLTRMIGVSTVARVGAELTRVKLTEDEFDLKPDIGGFKLLDMLNPGRDQSI